MPERLYDDPDELADWARRSMAVAQRSGTKAKKARPKSNPKKKSAVKKSACKRR
jgi:DNA transformation protein